MSARTDADAYAVVVSRERGGEWLVDALPEAVTADVDALVAAVRRQPASGAVALVDVADEFFVAVRERDGRVQLLLSDVTAALEWDLAAQVVEHLDLEPPPEDASDVEPAGDLDIFDDLGLDARELAAILSDVDAYADEMLSSLARRLGFAEPYERVVDALVQQRPSAAT